ncbi:hypothetical protein [Anabaena sp. AL93]|uniref:hypothetical protein n=1 Tax=Anabaena sp. AL93 TaxID=1678133 RepID=UPI0007FF16D3|nr:hypothetical protein [Anabaena sp. AL93]OBQ15571.1 MAG: hypothetical protein AN486_22770 [Anabaena sp. AL93]
MSNLLLTTVPIEQQETIIGGGGSGVNISDINALGIGENNVVFNNITIINMIFNFFIYPLSQNRKHRRCKF